MTTESEIARALQLYLSDPVAARELAAELDRRSLAAADWVSASKAERILGLAAGHLSDVSTAVNWLSSAVKLARRGDDRPAEAMARADLAYALGRQGRTAAALKNIQLARRDLNGADASRLHLREGQIFKQLGRWPEAVDAYQLALRLVRHSGDRSVLAVVLGNRGVAQLYTGALDGAERDLREADALFADLGQGFQRAIILHNLGYAAAYRGDVPLALQRYDLAEQAYLAHREVPLELWRDRCELLLATGLNAEALQSARKAVLVAAGRGEAGELAEAQLRLAEAALANGLLDLAAEMAALAAKAFVRQRRGGWAALAGWTEILADLNGDSPGTAASTIRRVATKLEAAGWTAAALEAWLRAAIAALGEGRPTMARRDLAKAADRSRSAPIWYRQQAFRARAMLHLLDGDQAKARRAAATGLALADQYRASLGATDLRAQVSSRVGVLARIGLRSALDTGRAQLVFSWAERTRAANLLWPPARPPRDSQLARDLGELRSLMALRSEAVHSGRPPGDDLMLRQVGLERSIRDRIRWLRGTEIGATQLPVTAGFVGELLAERALVEYVFADGEVHAVTISGGRTVLHHLGALAPLSAQLARVPFVLKRLSTARTPESAEAALILAGRCAGILDEALVQPLLRRIGDRELVLVPTGPLQSVPWGLLPSCRTRAFSISPSARLWCNAIGAHPKSGGVVLIAGPDLPHSVPEVMALARLYPEATVLTGKAATAGELLRLSEGARLLHIAAHGNFRDDNALFSSLDLADGPLTVYDMQGLNNRPDQVVLSSCQSGRNAVLPGDELLGMAAGFLNLGVRTVVCSAVDVDDAVTDSLMQDFHHRIAAGLPIALALANTRGAVERDDTAGMAASSAFACYGAG